MATVTITVTPVADAPIAADVDVTTNEDAAVDIPLIGSDADGDALSFAVTGGPAHGAVVCVGASCTYTPAANFHGIDTFTYTVTDPGGLSDTATVTITVRAVNDAPVALDDTATTPEDTAVAVAVLGNDSDVDGDSLTVVAVGAPSAGSAMIVGGNVVYTPAANFHGTDSFTYTVMDPGGLTAAATVTITVTPVNDGPVASDITVTAAEDTALDITLAGGDLDGDALSFAVTDGPAHGTLTCDGASCTYSPAPNFNGTDTVTFTVTDPGGLSDAATVTITVSPVNDAPVVVGAGGLTVAEGASVSLTASVTDVDSTIFTYSWSPAAGLNSQTAAAPTFTAVDDGTYPFAVTVCDDATPAVCTAVADAVVVTVSNVVPTVTASAPLSASVGVAVSAVVSSYTDPGLVDTHSATIDWGDGTAPDGPVAVTDGSIAGTHSFASPGTYTVTVCVTDDDGGTACATTTATVTSGLPVLSIGDTSVEEGDSGLQTLVFTIALSAPTTQAVRVGWLTWPGTATEGTGTILDPEDYRAVSGTARIPAGATSVTVRVQVAGDLVAEGPETLFVDLELPVNAVIGDGRGVGTILDGEDSCTVVGTSASEVLVGTDGDDVLCGLRGDDVYDPRGGDDTIVDTGGSDTITYAQAPAGVVVDLAAGAATGWGSDTFGGIERAIGSEHDDELLGSDAADELTGLGGDDHLVGLGRDDTLLGGDGDDEFDGGEGGDLMRGGAGSDSVVGGGGNDFVIAGDGDDTVDAGAGADSVFGDGGADDLQGGDGNDTMSGGDGDDRVGGGAGRDLLRGDGGNDHLLGDAGNDVLEGGEGNDVLEGGANDDRLDGGPGDDRSDGGAAKDTCAAGGPADLLIGCEST